MFAPRLKTLNARPSLAALCDYLDLALDKAGKLLWPD